MNKNEIISVADLVKKSAQKFGGKTFLKELVKGEVSEKTFGEFYKIGRASGRERVSA